MKYLKTKNGYTLLFAVLAAVLVMGVAVFILSVSRKQFILTATARDSMYAFYAADTGIECFTNTANNHFNSTSGGNITCYNNTSLNYNIVSPPQMVGFTLYNDPVNNVPVHQFNVSIPLNTISVSQKTCAILTVTTGLNSNNISTTVVDSRGYNQCTTGATPAPDTTQLTTVERALRLTQNGVSY